jgi:hypothetical protein
LDAIGERLSDTTIFKVSTHAMDKLKVMNVAVVKENRENEKAGCISYDGIYHQKLSTNF